MADWTQIKSEYIATNTSYRKLAKKYGVNYRVICERSQKEHWIEQREQNRNEMTTKLIQTIGQGRIDRAERLLNASDRLMERVADLIEAGDVTADTGCLKDLTRVLRDIKEIQDIKSDADTREQEARIANLERQNRQEIADHDECGVVLMPPTKPLEPPEDEDDA